MSTALLKEACDQQNMKRVAMIDDVFDTPDPKGLDRTRYNAFRTAFNGDELLRTAIRRASGRRTPELPRFSDLEDEQLEAAWRALWRARLGESQLADDKVDQLRALFTGHRDGLLAMLDLVATMLGLFRDDLGCSVQVFGTSFDARKAARADIVLVDFFLGRDLTKEQALKVATGAVADIVDAARRARQRTPSFLLVSSRKQDVDIERFQTAARLMKSRFRFFPKQALTNDNTAELVSLHDLVEGSSQAAIVEGLIEDWRRGAKAAVDVVYDRMMKLDVADLVYLDFFRLTREGTSVGNYLRWFLTASLAARVTGELTPGVWAKSEGVRLFDFSEDGDPSDTGSLAKTFDGPTAAIADAYGDILFDETRGYGTAAFPRKIQCDDLVEGDLFVRPLGKDRQTLNGAGVLLVMTPSCDLLSRSARTPPAAGSVLLLKGVLRSIRLNVDNRVVDQTVDYVRVKERGAWQTFHLDWDLASPVAIPWTAVSTNGPGKGFRRLGRIRELYFHKIRDRFAGKLTRIGTEVPPLFPRARAGTVHLRRMEGKKAVYDELTRFSVEDELLWEFGEFKLAERKGGQLKEGKAVLMYQGTRLLIERVRTVLDRIPADPEEQRTAADEAGTILVDMAAYMSIMRPMKPGVRGGENGVEILAVATSEGDHKSRLGNAKGAIVIIPTEF